ncbi:MAG: glycosyltransferase family 2 protein, partial [Cyanobacteria bacterium J06639_1]
MSDPLVSIIIPTYNAEAFLAETLASCFAQDYASIEVIVVDDGSQDGTIAVVESLMAEEPRLQLFRSINQGQCVSRNIGIALSKGEYLKFLDHDDLLTPWSISYQLEALQTFAAGIAIGKPIKCNNQKMRDTYRDLSEHPPAETEPVTLWKGKLVEANRQFSPTPNEMLMRRDPVVSAGGFNRFLATGEEANLMLKIQVRCPDTKLVSTYGKIVVCKRVYEGALSVALRKDTYTSWGLASLIDRAQFILEGNHDIDRHLQEYVF